MNARGVQLTEFENFKAWLQGYTEDEIDAQDRKDFFSKLDREWTDFLWNLKCKFEDSKEKNEAFDFDSMFMQVFKSVLLCHFYRNEDIDHKNKQQSEQSSDPTHETDEKSLLSRLRKNLFVSSEEYKRILQGTNGCLKEILQNVSRLFDFLINHKEDLEIETILRQVFKPGTSSYLDQAHFAILYFYVQHIDRSEQFSDWFNISARLVNNAKGYYNFERAKNLRDLFPVKFDDGSSRHILFLSDDAAKNKYQVTNQITIDHRDHNGRTSRFDVTLLVNGLPLVQIELKKRGMEIAEAFNQTQRYTREAYWAGQGLFSFIQLFVISNGANTRYYSNGTKHIDFAFPWADAANKHINEVVDFADAFLNTKHLTAMLTQYMVMHETSKELMVLRPYQIYAVQKIIGQVSTTKLLRANPL